jgi:hypothetical protein
MSVGKKISTRTQMLFPEGKEHKKKKGSKQKKVFLPSGHWF